MPRVSNIHLQLAQAGLQCLRMASLAQTLERRVYRRHSEVLRYVSVALDVALRVKRVWQLRAGLRKLDVAWQIGDGTPTEPLHNLITEINF